MGTPDFIVKSHRRVGTQSRHRHLKSCGTEPFPTLWGLLTPGSHVRTEPDGRTKKLPVGMGTAHRWYQQPCEEKRFGPTEPDLSPWSVALWANKGMGLAAVLLLSRRRAALSGAVGNPGTLALWLPSRAHQPGCRGRFTTGRVFLLVLGTREGTASASSHKRETSGVKNRICSRTSSWQPGPRMGWEKGLG